jgi:DNA-binding MarR family transcriptional regulator
VSFPALLDAADDPLLVQKGSVAALYLYLLKRLDFVQYRRQWGSRIAEELHVKPKTVSQALRLLIEGGYVERGPKVMDVYTYRLVFARQRQNAPKG